MQKLLNKRIITLIVALMMIMISFTACSGRMGGESSEILDEFLDVSDTDERPEPPEGAGRIDDSHLLEHPPELTVLVAEKWEKNNDTVGWLKVPGTNIDDVVVWKEGDNDYYVRRNFDKRYYYNGVYFADKRSTFDGTAAGLGRNTVIYGHSMSDNKDDIKFGPMRYYLEEDFAKQHPYLYFSTNEEDLVWEIVAVFYTHWDIPYNRNDLKYEEFKKMYDEVAARSVFNYNHELSEDDKFLTLSTCIYSLPDKGVLEYPNPYRLGIMARLVKPGEALSNEANFTVNTNIKSA